MNRFLRGDVIVERPITAFVRQNIIEHRTEFSNLLLDFLWSGLRMGVFDKNNNIHRDVLGFLTGKSLSLFSLHIQKSIHSTPPPPISLSLSSARSLLRSLPMFLYVQKQNLLTVLEETNETSPPGSAFAAPYSREPICPENPAVSAVS